jgi:predicted nucleic acid-binding protein
MIVVSDTSPLNYLVLIDAVHVLPAIFRQVFIPEQVARELGDSGAPNEVQAWIAAPPDCLVVRSPIQTQLNLKLDPGEVQAIGLAEELRADHILIDEWAARTVAANRGLHVIGTLGVLNQAAERGLIDLSETCIRLLKTSFRINRQLIDQLIEDDAQRKRRT